MTTPFLTEFVTEIEDVAPEIIVEIADVALKGDKGDTGDRGLQGLKGDKGDTGDRGLQGDDGPPLTLVMGSITEVDRGEEFASITGSSPDLTLNLGIPVGITVSEFTDAVNALTTVINAKATAADISSAITNLSLGTASQHDTSYFARPSDITSAISAEATARNAAISSALTTLIGTAPSVLDTLGELAAQMQSDETGISAIVSTIATIQTALVAKSPLASPAFSGSPSAPTPANSDDSTRVATTAFVKSVVSLLSTVYTPQSRTINGHPLSADVSLTSADTGSDTAGAAASMLTSANAYTDTNITSTRRLALLYGAGL